MKIREYYGVSENRKNEFERYYKITLTETTFERTASGKSWKKNPVSIEEKVINFEEYFNYLSSVQRFRKIGGYEKVEKAYTPAGYVVYKMISISPNKDKKIERKFKIEHNK